jgi:hypothetical protein
VVVVGLGDHLLDSQPKQALALGRDSPDVLSAVGEQLLKAKDYPRAARMALAALDRSPLNVDAMRVRALAQGAQGQTAAASAELRFAGRRSWRDAESQAWLIQEALVRRRYDEAFRHADALARGWDEPHPLLFRFFDLAVGDAAASEALAARLDPRPDWRPSFLDTLANSRQTDAAVARLFERVDRGPAPLTSSEMASYIGRLAREGDYRAAHMALGRFKAGRALTATPFDGDFAGAKGVAPFAWTATGTAGADLTFSPAPGRAGENALRVEYDGYSSTDLISQVVALNPGPYQISGEAYIETGLAQQLHWELRCLADGHGLGRVSAKDDGGAAAWRRFSLRFEVPAAGCDGVRLVLAGAPGERRSTIIVWFGRLAIQAVGPTTRPSL